MFWIKKSLFTILLSVIFSGCGYNEMVALGLVPDPSKGKVYLERFENDEFLDYIIERNYIEGLKKEDVIYMDQYLSGHKISKLIFTKTNWYTISTPFDNETLREYRRIQFNLFKSTYATKEFVLKTEIRKNKLFIKKHYNLKWYELRLPMRMSILSRYNDIHKIKEVIDERVEYYKKHGSFEEDEK